LVDYFDMDKKNGGQLYAIPLEFAEGCPPPERFPEKANR
jgi:hypothetical protein